MKLQTKLPLILASAAIVGLLSGRPLWARYGVFLIRNHSASVSKGFYRVVPIKNWKCGALVVFPLPKAAEVFLRGRPWLLKNVSLIKPVGALPGDHVCIHAHSIDVNRSRKGEVFATDLDGRSLPKLRGCFRVRPRHFFPLSTHSPHSFDGRYFGEIPMRQAVGEAVTVITWK